MVRPKRARARFPCAPQCGNRTEAVAVRRICPEADKRSLTPAITTAASIRAKIAVERELEVLDIVEGEEEVPDGLKVGQLLSNPKGICTRRGLLGANRFEGSSKRKKI